VLGLGFAKKTVQTLKRRGKGMGPGQNMLGSTFVPSAFTILGMFNIFPILHFHLKLMVGLLQTQVFQSQSFPTISIFIHRSIFSTFPHLALLSHHPLLDFG
jgi:hypothetical protein